MSRAARTSAADRTQAMAPPGTPVVIRRAAADDLVAVREIEAASFSDPWAPSAFAALIHEPVVYFSVAERDGRLAGFAVLTVAADEAEILNLAVPASMRRGGVGAQLLDDMIRDGRARGARTMYLDVRASNVAARALYASRGFAEAGRRRRYYSSPVEDALSLRLMLAV